jgi:hypothetical protein
MYMKISTPKDKIKIIRKDDSDFSMSVGMYSYPRAGFEIDDSCPDNIRDFLYDCIRKGWVKPVAYMRESEYIWEELSK